jgi:hypothetical protein
MSLSDPLNQAALSSPLNQEALSTLLNDESLGIIVYSDLGDMPYEYNLGYAPESGAWSVVYKATSRTDKGKSYVINRSGSQKGVRNLLPLRLAFSKIAITQIS